MMSSKSQAKVKITVIGRWGGRGGGEGEGELGTGL